MHPFIKNYKSITNDDKYIKLDIVKVDNLTGNETVGYLKTFWLRVVQRRWKKVFKERERILKIRQHPKSRMHFRSFGKWPKGAEHWPQFRLFAPI